MYYCIAVSIFLYLTSFVNVEDLICENKHEMNTIGVTRITWPLNLTPFNLYLSHVAVKCNDIQNFSKCSNHDNTIIQITTKELNLDKWIKKMKLEVSIVKEVNIHIKSCSISLYQHINFRFSILQRKRRASEKCVVI